VIDVDGYRLNVGIILCNSNNELLWARRIGQNAWQFPQGGIRKNESYEDALFRELYEEIGLSENDISIIGATSDWLYYQLPKELIRYGTKPLCIGQKQRWFLLQLESGEENINLESSSRPEFDDWRWVDFWHPLNEVVEFKRDVYHAALSSFEKIIFGDP